MILPVLARGVYWTLGGIQAVGELIGGIRRLVTTARRGLVPHVDDSVPSPLPHRDVERIAEFGRRAGHEKK